MLKLVSIALILSGCVYAQPNLPGLTVESGTVNAASATATRPIKVVTTLPATCTVGDMAFKSNETAGQNLYGCTATNTWTLQAGGGSATDINGMVPSRSSATVLAVSAGGWRIGGLPGVNTFAGGNITKTGGSGSVLWCLGSDQPYITVTGTLTVSRPAGTGDGGTGTACPAETVEKWRWNADDNSTDFDATQGTGNAKDYSIASPPPCNTTDTVTGSRDANGGCNYSSAPYNIFDISQVWFLDDFSYGTTSTGNVGTMGWNTNNISGSTTMGNTTGEANHPGVSSITTAGAANNGGCLVPSASATNFYYLTNQTADGNTRLQWIIKTPSDASNTRIGIGFLATGTMFGASSGLAATTTTRVFIEADQTDSDTVWRFRQCTGGNCTTGNSTVSYATSTWFRMNIQSTSAGTWSYSVDNETPVDLTGTMPTFDSSPAACIWTATAATRTLRLDRVAFQKTGLTR